MSNNIFLANKHPKKPMLHFQNNKIFKFKNPINKKYKLDFSIQRYIKTIKRILVARFFDMVVEEL